MRRRLRPQIVQLEDRLAPAGLIGPPSGTEPTSITLSVSAASAQLGAPVAFHVDVNWASTTSGTVHAGDPPGKVLLQLGPRSVTLDLQPEVSTADLTVTDLSAGITQVRATYVPPTGSEAVVSSASTTVEVKGKLDIVTAAGAGTGAAPWVVGYDRDGRETARFLAFDETFTGGVRVAVGDVNGDGVMDIVAAAGPGGGPHVKVFDGATNTVTQSFYAYDPSFKGGVTVAVGDLLGTEAPYTQPGPPAEIVTGAGPGGGPHVKIFDGKTGETLQSFFSGDATVTTGVSVAALNAGTEYILEKDGVRIVPHRQVVTAVGVAVKVFDPNSLAVLKSFDAYDPAAFAGPVNIASGADFTGDGKQDLVTAAGEGGGPHVKVFDGQTWGEKSGFLAYDPEYAGGVSVGVTKGLAGGKATIVTGAMAHRKLFNGTGTELDELMAFDAETPGRISVSGGEGTPTYSVPPVTTT